MSSDDDSLIKNVTAKLLSERIDLKNIRTLFKPIATSPFIFQTAENNLVVLFRYGVGVFFGSDSEEISQITAQILPFMIKPCLDSSEEINQIIFHASEDTVEYSGTICFKDANLERFQLCAEVLARSVVLNNYENKLAHIFEKVEPLAEDLKNRGRSQASLTSLYKHTGEIILSMTQTIGQAELAERPDILWDQPELERLYSKLVDEYEIRERSLFLQQKLVIADNAVNSFINLKHHNYMSMLVWGIIILITTAIIVDFI